MHVVQGNIVKLAVDAIVNAANSSLLGGGGVDGAIHRAAGKELLAECRTLNGCQVGGAKLTRGYKLPAKWVIHTVGPVWNGGGSGEAAKLASAYRRSLEVARDAGAQTVAFPCISTGVYRYPLHKACEVAVRTIAEFLEGNATPTVVTLCTFDDDATSAMEQALQASSV